MYFLETLSAALFFHFLFASADVIDGNQISDILKFSHHFLRVAFSKLILLFIFRHNPLSNKSEGESPDRCSRDGRSPSRRSVSPRGRLADSRSPSPQNSDVDE